MMPYVRGQGEVPRLLQNKADKDITDSLPTLKIRRQDGFELVYVSLIKMIGAADNLKLRFGIPSRIGGFDQI